MTWLLVKVDGDSDALERFCRSSKKFEAAVVRPESLTRASDEVDVRMVMKEIDMQRLNERLDT